MWTVRMVITVFTIYEVGVSDALSTGYLMLGSNVKYAFNDRTHLLSIPLQTENGNTTIYFNRSYSVSYNNYLTRPESIDVDYGRKQLYIYDRYTATLQKLNFNPESSNPNLTLTYLHSGLSRGEVKIALDWISNNLYWTDPTFRTVIVQSLRNDGNYKILVFDDVEKPTGIAVDPIHQYLFWSDVGSLPKIERSTLTGSSRKTIVSQGIAYPIALDVDILSSKLYWVDSYRDSVERSNLDGTDRVMIKRLAHSTFLDIQVFSDVILTTDIDINLGGLVRLFNKDTGVDDKGNTIVRSAKMDFLITCVTLYAPQPTTTDHCASSPCENICVSESTRPVCLCAEGFALNIDGRTCSETTGFLHRALVWATTTTLCAADIRGIHDESEYITSNKTCFSNVGSNINWITVDSHDRKIIFADGSDIFAMTLDGDHTKQRITSATETVTGLAVDWVDKNVYWCQGQPSGTGKINVFSQTTTNTHTVISSGLDNPKALNIIPLPSTMIWINGRLGSYQIKKAHVNGNDIQTIVSFMDLSEPRDLTVDIASQRLYFIDGNALKSVQLDGTKLTAVDGGVANSILPLKLHSYKNHLLVADAGINIDVVSLTNTGSATYTLNTLASVTDICVVDITEQPKQNGPCNANNGNCEHICIPLGIYRECQCSYGFILDSNKETCSSEPLSDNFMYVSDWTHDKVYQVSLINDAVNALDSSTIDAPTGVLYNSITNRIYWGDTTSNYIQSANVNGAGYSVLIDVGAYRAHPDRLAIDYSTGNIYYTAVNTSQLPASFTGIGIVSPNGHHRKLISEGVSPRAVEIDPSKGFLFWTDFGTTPAVLKRAHTDGTNIVTLYSAMVWPNGIAIDRSASALYVTDGYTNIIYRCGYEANTCVQYFSDPGSHLMDIKLLGNYLYYTAWNKLYITKLHKTNSSDIGKFANNAELGRLDSISLYSSAFLQTNVQSQCSNNNGRGNCSTFCHPTPNNFTCGCPDGEQLLPDRKTCPNDCGLPKHMPKGNISLRETTNTSYGAMADVSCNTGYEPSTSQITCTTSGLWENASCHAIDCGNPASIRNGTIVLFDAFNTTYGAFANVSCSQGYEHETSQIICKVNGEWQNASCRPRDCGALPLLQNGNLTLRQHGTSTFGASASVNCTVGHVPTTIEITCMSDGFWSAASCNLIECNLPKSMPNGNISLRDPTKTSYGTMADVSCYTGYESTTPQITCTTSRTWENASCNARDCGDPASIRNGTIVLFNAFNTTYGSLANVSCSQGFEQDTSQIMCGANGEWQNASCRPRDCGPLPLLQNGNLTLLQQGTSTFGASANVNCSVGHFQTASEIACMFDGIWSAASCNPIDCGPTPFLQNGFVQTPDGTTFGKTAVYTCIPGYTLIGFPVISCRSSGWPLIDNACVMKDCGHLKNPTKGQVDMNKGSAYQAVARYTCYQGYDLIGDEKRMCQSTGTWSGIQPFCISKEQTKVVCKTNVDIRGTEWKEVIQGSTRVQQCAEGFEGNITRVCLNDGTWQLPQYNCVRKTVTNVAEKVETFVSNASADMVSNALEQIVNVTGNEATTNTSELLTDAEITVLANSLDQVAEIVVNKSLSTENVVKAYVQSVSNLVDERNKQSWETMKQHNSYGGENMLASVDKIGVALREKVAMGEEGFTNITIVQKNVALEVKKVNNQDIVFPYSDIKIDQHQDQIWAKTSDSSIRLKAKAIGDTEVIVTVVIYKDMSHVLPNTSETPIGAKTNDQQINGPILSLSLSNHFGKLNPPVLLTFERMKANLTSPVCSYWTFGRKNETGYWASDGCVLLNSDENKTVCQCDHLTNFAVLMSPFVEADAASVPLRTLSTVGMGISMACLLITMLTYIYLWRFLKSDRTILLLNLCGALMLSYIIFLAGVDKTANKALCSTTAVLLHYIYLVVFCLMLAEGIDIAIMTVYVFSTKSRLKPLLITAWVSPAMIVAISLLSTRADGYGNEKVCWLSLERGLIWAFVAPSLLIILFNIVCLVLILRNMFHMKAMDRKTSMEKIKTSLRSLCVLVPLMGLSWILGIFYVNETSAFMQYLFALFNTLQGLFIFIFHCIFNQQVGKAVRSVHNKHENLKSFKRSTQKTYNKSFKSSFNSHSENDSSTSQHQVSEDNSVGPRMNVYSRLRDNILSKKKVNLIDNKCEDPIPFSSESSIGSSNVVLRALRFINRNSRVERSHSTKSASTTATQL